jgi:hypothetical protein
MEVWLVTYFSAAPVAQPNTGVRSKDSVLCGNWEGRINSYDFVPVLQKLDSYVDLSTSQGVCLVSRLPLFWLHYFKLQSWLSNYITLILSITSTRKFVVYVCKLNDRKKNMIAFSFNIHIVMCMVCRKPTRLILRGWWVLLNNNFVFLDKSTKLATFGTLGTFRTRS